MRLRTRIFLDVAPLVVLGLVAWLVVAPLNSLLEGELVAPLRVPPTQTPSPQAATRGLPTQRLHELFALLRRPAPPAAPPPPFAGRLLGTLTSRTPGASVATLLLPGGRGATVWEGDRVLDAQLVAVSRQFITLQRNGGLETLYINQGPGEPRPLPPTGPADYTLSRSEVRTRLDDLYGLARQVHVIPAFREGRAIGFRFVGIAPESPLLALGLKAGDVLRTVNGQSLDSMQRVLSLPSLLEQPQTIVLELERDGQPLTQRYRLD